jgi:fused signal recognition particle receptor
MQELGIPVQWVGLGEGIEDLVPFDPESYVQGIFGVQ